MIYYLKDDLESQFEYSKILTSKLYFVAYSKFWDTKRCLYSVYTMAVRCQQDLIFSSQTCRAFESDLLCFDSDLPCLESDVPIFWVSPSRSQSFSFFVSDIPIFLDHYFSFLESDLSIFSGQSFPLFQASASHFSRQTSFPFFSLYPSGFCLFYVPI